MRRFSPWLAALSVIGCLGLGGLYLRREAAFAKEEAGWDAGRKQGEQRLAALRDEGAAARKSAEAARQAKPSPVRAAPAGPHIDPDTVILHLSDLVREHPELAEMRRRDFRNAMMRNFGPVIAGLNLPPAVAARLKDLLTELQSANEDAANAASAAGLQRGSPEWRDAVRAAGLRLQQEITDTLQPSTGLNFQQLQARIGFVNQVQNDHGPALAAAGVPLTAEQSQGLVQAMADANYAGKDLSTRPANYNERDASGLTPHEQRILAGAAASLAPAQLDAVRTSLLEAGRMQTVLKQYAGVSILP